MLVYIIFNLTTHELSKNGLKVDIIALIQEKWAVFGPKNHHETFPRPIHTSFGW